MVIDYFSLLKTRTVLYLLSEYHVTRLRVLVVTLFFDLIVGICLFFVGFGLVAGGLLLWVSLPDVSAFSSLWYFMLAIFDNEFRTYHFSNLIDFPLGTLFWAGMMPSVWLWLYLGAALLTRLIARSAPLLRFLTYFLDIDGHPIRSIGVVAAVLVSGGYGVYLVVSGLVA